MAGFSIAFAAAALKKWIFALSRDKAAFHRTELERRGPLKRFSSLDSSAPRQFHV
jgi:hypothetical protein